MEFGCPVTWQKQMVLQDFDVTNVSIPEFLAFCERLERAESYSNYSTSEDKKDKSPIHREKRSHRKESSRKSGRNAKDGHFCALHGKGDHSTDDCRELAKKRKHFREEKKSYDKPRYKKDYKPFDKKKMKAMMAEVAHEHFSMQTKIKRRKVQSDSLAETMAALESASLDESQKTASVSSADSKNSKESFDTETSKETESSLSSDSS